MRSKLILSALATGVLFLFGSCEREEPLYKLDIEPGISEIKTLDLGPGYINQVYFDLSTGNFTSNDFKVWDLAFPSDVLMENIRMNDGNSAHLALTNTFDIYEKLEVPVDGWQFDESCGCPDSCAIGQWWEQSTGEIRSKRIVYILDRGEEFTEDRYFKFQISEYTKEAYKVKFADLDGGDVMELKVDIDPEKNFNYLNFAENRICSNEPWNRADWDLVFRPYRHIYYDLNPIVEYLVVGSLLNPFMVTAHETTTFEYDEINYDIASKMFYSYEWDLIGFDWKAYDRDLDKYAVDHSKVFVIKDTEGVYYKLRFLDFYNNLGEKGFPKFEFERI
jgi:hypothetical protein